jgi:hypothetical protein
MLRARMTLPVALGLLALLPAGAGARAGHRAVAHAIISTSPTQVVAPLPDKRAAGLVRVAVERRPDNAADNARAPSAAQLARFRASDRSLPPKYLKRIDGGYKGTTDEIIQWAAYKWGLDADLLRAVAAVESWWHMSTVGDGGNAFGLFQSDARYHCCAGLAANDTAFNADYYGAIVRSYYDGAQTWLNTVAGNGRRYAAGDLWDSLGYWASGRWDTPVGAGYVAQVRADLAQQVWQGQWF